MKEETFGPVIPIQKVSSDEEAIKLMNDSEYGLTASIWTRDDSMGEKLAEKVEAGTVFVNRADYPSPVSHYPSLSDPIRIVPRTFSYRSVNNYKKFELTQFHAGSRVDRMERFWAWGDSQ